MKIMSAFLVVMVTAVAGGLSAANAQQPASPAAPAPVKRLVECRNIADPEARLRCYDGAVDSLNAAVAGGSIVLVDREDVRRTRRSLFGFSLPKLPFFSGDDSQDDTPSTIIAEIKSVKPLPNNKFLIELDSGALWQTLQEAGFQATPKVGEKIRVSSGALGSYRVSVSGRPPLRAMRIR